MGLVKDLGLIGLGFVIAIVSLVALTLSTVEYRQLAWCYFKPDISVDHNHSS